MSKAKSLLEAMEGSIDDQIAKGKEVEMSEYISNLATVNDPSQMIKAWPGLLPGVMEGLLYHKSFIDESPMEIYLDSYFRNFTKVEKKLVIAAVDIESG